MPSLPSPPLPPSPPAAPSPSSPPRPFVPGRPSPSFKKAEPTLASIPSSPSAPRLPVSAMPFMEPPARSGSTALKFVTVPSVADNVTWLPLTAVIVAPSGIPEPVTSIPTSRPSALTTVIVFPDCPVTWLERSRIPSSGIVTSMALSTTRSPLSKTSTMVLS